MDDATKQAAIEALKAKLKAMEEPQPIPDPTIPVPGEKPSVIVNNGPSLLQSCIAAMASSLVTIAIVAGGLYYYRGVDPAPGPDPKPVVVEPTKFVPADSIATLNGIRLDTDRTKLICDLVNAGNGTFILRYQPVGKEEITRTIVVSGGIVPPVPVPPGPTPPVPPVVDPTTKPTAATYIYEKDQNAVPSAVMSGLNRLNREQKIIATVFEDDSTNGRDSVPAQYKVAYDAAKKEGLPVLVVTAGDRVLKTIKAPKTEAEIMEAVK